MSLNCGPGGAAAVKRTAMSRKELERAEVFPTTFPLTYLTPLFIVITGR